jgi:chorismate mutase/GNAT superfamily N-acetyltransferase
MPIDPEGPVTFRPAEASDSVAIAELYGLVRQAAVPAIPPPVHSPGDDVVYFAGLLTEGAEVWVAEEGADTPRLIAFSVLQADWLHSLYVHPEATGLGVGTTLLEQAKVLRPQGFGLWVFESNLAARAFYERRGLVAVRRTDGSANEEGAPDVEMLWPGLNPVGRLRQAIDQVDQELATLLEVRAGLTAHVQAHKAAPGSGPAPRDPGREAEIVHRMARSAPRLGEKRLARIMHAVIAESLDAVPKGPRED